MANKRYREDDDGEGLDQRVRGPKGEAAKFKEFKGVEGSVEEERSNLNKTGVAMPQDSEKSLPKAGKAE